MLVLAAAGNINLALAPKNESELCATAAVEDVATAKEDA